MATVQKRGDSYRIIVSCGYDSHGKQIRRSTTWTPKPGMTKKQAEKELERAKVLFEEQCKNGASGGNIKFEAFTKQFLEERVNGKLKENTRQRYYRFTDRTFPALGHLRIDKITRRHIQRFVSSLEADGMNQQTGGKLSPKTVRGYLSFVSTILEYAVELDMIPMNPCHNIKVAEGKRFERKIFTIEEAQRFIELLDTAPLVRKTFFILAIYGGFRKGELLGLEWKDINFKANTVTIRREAEYTTDKGHYTDTPKTDKAYRVIHLPVPIMDILKRRRIEQTEQRLKAGDLWEDSDRIFVNELGRLLGNASMYNWLRRFCESNNIPPVSIHSFRHLNASLLITSGVDPRTVSASLGHSQTSTTLNIYAHTFAEAQAQASEAIANALNLNQKKA